jgi:protein TonB
MKAQLASDYAEDHTGDGWGSSPAFSSPPSLVGPPTGHDYEYGTYGQSRRPNPFAAAASILVAAGAFASFLFIGGHHDRHHHREHRLTVMELVDLQPPPPPPPPPPPARVQAKQETPPEIVSPPAIVQTVAPPSPVITALKPAPALIGAGTSEVHAPVSVPAPPSQETANVGDLSARMISATPPSYPLDSRRSMEQGTVVLAVMLGVDGRVASVSVSKSSGSSRLDHAALNAVKHWRWAPMVRNGNPVLVQGLVTIPFVLHV